MKLIPAALLLLAAATCAAQTPAATDLTVRLFSTHIAHRLDITPATGATMQTCPTCAPTPVPSTLHIDAAKPSTALTLQGQLRLTTDDGATATGAGRWHITAAPDGLHATLTLPSERYVMAVLTSEAPADASPAALKALAVVARSFALVNPHRHGTEGLCDSTHCQAMRLAPVPARIESAVHATAGETLWHGPTRVAAYFTQSCGGHTEDAAEAWGGPHRSWLPAHPDPYCQRQPSQWHASVSLEDLRTALAQEGLHPPARLDDLRLTRRSTSGRATQLQLVGGGGSTFIAAATLRFAIDRRLGWNTLRSDWYNVHIAQGRAIFDGKGYGHGVGLCQFGAEQMARQGKSYRDILAFYFPSAQVRIGPTDDGWHSLEATGWTLVTTGDSAALKAAGDTAFAMAQHTLPGFPAGHPILTAYPTTELFRQSTTEPGWMLATTRGQSIALQPASVVAQHGGLNALLLHEFLHSLIEQRATAAAPLWLREGLVEVLAESQTDQHATAPALTVAQTEASLQAPKSATESQRAHAAARALAQRVIAQHGMSVVLSWLQSGVPASAAL